MKRAIWTVLVFAWIGVIFGFMCIFDSQFDMYFGFDPGSRESTVFSRWVDIPILIILVVSGYLLFFRHKKVQ